MTRYSITRRIVATVLLCEFVLAAGISIAAVLYERHEQIVSFQIRLRGRADSVFGAVGDAGDEADSLALDTHSLDLPPEDVYEVRQDQGPLLGRTRNWSGPPQDLKADKNGWFFTRVNGHRYRGLILRGLRSVDSTGNGDGIQYHVTVYYASPMHPLEKALHGSIRFFILTDLCLLVITGVAMVIFLRRAARPLQELAAQAALVNPHSLSFSAPQSVYDVQELTPLASALDTAMQGIERAFVQQRDFLSDAAHELKTAMTLVKSSLQLLGSRERTVQEYSAGLEQCLADCARMEDLIMKMLTLARLEQLSPERVQHSQTSLRDKVADVIAQVESFASLRQVIIESRVSEALNVDVPVEDLETLIKNLLLNAVQYSEVSGLVKILTEEFGRTVRFTITDSGRGIAPEHLYRIFDRFYRGDASRSRNTGGTGLGLAICKAIAEAYGGSLSIESQLELGTTVTVIMPKV